jgi:hypothetical protein
MAMRSRIKENITRQLVRKRLVHMLNDDINKMDELVREFTEIVREDIQIGQPFIEQPIRPPRKDPLLSSKNPRPMINRSRARIRWSREEIQTLVRFYHQDMSWMDIQSHFTDRTNMDCKDKWRNLIKKYHSEQEIYARFLK